MKRIGLLIGFFTAVAFMLPDFTVQAQKKDEPKKDEVKKDDKKDPDKKEEKKEKLVYGTKFVGKVLGVKPDTNREYTIEKYEIDPKKVQEFQTWQAQRNQQLARQQFEANTQKDFKARVQAQANYQKAVYEHQVEVAKRQNNLTSPKSIEVRGAENAKVRTIPPPVEFDDAGFQKKWTKKELEERKDKTGLPGFPSDFSAIKAGQTVEVYLTKQAPMVKGKKKTDDEEGKKDLSDFVLIVIVSEASK
jgi:hypothetical protein